MKKILLVFILLLIISCNVLKAQNLIAVQNGVNASFYTTLDAAITGAQNGDTIYIPGGGIYNFNNYYINKRLHLIGVGHNNDSSQTTGVTYISSNHLFLQNGSSGSSIEGIYLSGDVETGHSNNDVDIDNILISRCNIGSIIVNSYSYPFCTGNNNVSNFLIKENVIRGAIIGLGGSSNTFYNNIIGGGVSFTGLGTIYQNNVFLQGYYVILSKNVNFANNIFISNPSMNLPIIVPYANMGDNCGEYDPGYNMFQNNLFVVNLVSPYCNACFEYNNLVGIDQNSIFVYQSGNTFSYTQDYHLKSNCVGKNAGKDGTDIGIYGGVFPWKEGSVPKNPHIINSTIGGTTNSNSALPINIKVSAQDH